MKWAARVGDAHVCGGSFPAPHGGGVIQGPGESSVMIGHRSAAVVGDTCPCVVGPANAISTGSGTVLVGYRPAARVSDATAHGGVLSSGCDSVIIGG